MNMGIFFFCFLRALIFLTKLCTYLYLSILFFTVIIDIVSSFLKCSLLAYGNPIDFCILIWYPVPLQNHLF